MFYMNAPSLPFDKDEVSKIITNGKTTVTTEKNIINDTPYKADKNSADTLLTLMKSMEK